MLPASPLQNLTTSFGRALLVEMCCDELNQFYFSFKTSHTTLLVFLGDTQNAGFYDSIMHGTTLHLFVILFNSMQYTGNVSLSKLGIKEMRSYCFILFKQKKKM